VLDSDRILSACHQLVCAQSKQVQHRLEGAEAVCPCDQSERTTFASAKHRRPQCESTRLEMAELLDRRAVPLADAAGSRGVLAACPLAGPGLSVTGVLWHRPRLQKLSRLLWLLLLWLLLLLRRRLHACRLLRLRLRSREQQRPRWGCRRRRLRQGLDGWCGLGGRRRYLCRLTQRLQGCDMPLVLRACAADDTSRNCLSNHALMGLYVVSHQPACAFSSISPTMQQQFRKLRLHV